MSDPQKNPDELDGSEQPFVSHLVELRDRLIRAVIAIAVAFAVLAIYPSPSGLYDFLAMPLVEHLPKGATLIATNPISPFMVPVKVTMLAAFMLAGSGSSVQAQSNEIGVYSGRHYNTDKELYRWWWLIRNNRAQDDYSRLMPAVTALGKSPPTFLTETAPLIDLIERVIGDRDLTVPRA